MGLAPGFRLLAMVLNSNFHSCSGCASINVYVYVYIYIHTHRGKAKIARQMLCMARVEVCRIATKSRQMLSIVWALYISVSQRQDLQGSSFFSVYGYHGVYAFVF